MILWHTKRDRFEPGQWLRGHVYERRCDLSPDGRQFVYFAHQMHRPDRSAMTVLSTPPNFTALKFWPKDNTWGGGGVFDAKGELRLNDDRGEDEPVQSDRLELHGWVKVQRGTLARKSRGSFPFDPPEISERRFEKYVLRRTVLGWDAKASSGWIELFDLDGHDLPRVTWADFDQSGRIVYARDGKLFTSGDRELADFNAMRPEPVPPS